MTISRLILMAIITLSIGAPTKTISQRNPPHTDSQFRYEPGVYLNVYRLSSPPPKDFVGFDRISLKPLPGQEHGEIKLDQRGNARIGGSLETTDKTAYKFKRALLIFDQDRYGKLDFTTHRLKTVSYRFDGRFLERAEREGDQYIELRGVLTKYINGKIIATAKLGFYKWAIE